MSVSTSSVRVALRVRPLTPGENQQQAKDIIKYIPDQPQILVDTDRSFTFDYIYPPDTCQSIVFDSAVQPLVTKFLEGYNATILAYGQTGSGKTYTMGTAVASDSLALDQQNGIVPRFIRSLFRQLETKYAASADYQVAASFLELYNEDLVDLLASSKKEISIREDADGQIIWNGVCECPVDHPQQLFDYLQQGSVARTTASTDMNHSSSRSHAIFSVILKQTLSTSPLDSAHPKPSTIISKFHFVDLAGSERLKRTNAVGERAKEGISINAGLLALGNVISALGDENKRRTMHVPYRDSKLTRLLQDSLGGNSQTLMVACASPADLNLAETLSTLNYANRARNIRNRVMINHDLDETDRLKWTISKLKEEQRTNDQYARALNDEMDALKRTVQQLQRSNAQLSRALAKRQQQTTTSNSTSTVSSPDDIHPPSPPLDSPGLEDDTLPSAAAAIMEGGKKKRSSRFGSLRKSWKGRFRPSTSIGPIHGITPSSTMTPTSSTSCSYHTIKAQLRQDRKFIQLSMGSLDTYGFSSMPMEGDETDLCKVLQLCHDTLVRYQKTNEHQQQWTKEWQQTDDKSKETMRQLERKTQGQQQKKSQANHQQQMAELIQQHEQKLRKQLTELQTLRRKHTQLVNTSATARSQHENTIRQLRTNLDGCKHEKKKLLKRIKLDAQRHQQQVHDWEKKCATLERQVSQAKRQQDHDLPKIKDFAKPSSSSTTTTHQQQLDALLAHVKKARDRHDWSLLSAKDLAPFRLPGKSNASSTSSSTTNSSTHRNATAKRGMHRASSRLGARMKSKLPTLPPSTDDKLDAIKRAIQSQSQRPIASRKLIPFVEKRQRLQQEQEELLKERLLIIEAEETHNQMERQYMDDRINQITLELDMIQSLLQQVDTEKGDDNDDVLSRSLLRQVTTMDDWVPLGEWFLRQVLESKQDQRLALMISGLLEKVLAKYQAAWDWLHQQPTSDQDRSFIEQAQMKCIDAQQVHLWNGLLLPQSPSSLPPLVTDSLSLSASNSDYTTITNPIDHPCGFDSTCKLPPSNDTIDTTTLV